MAVTALHDAEPAPRPDDQMPPALAVAGVGHAFGDRPALEDVSLSVAAGAFCVLLGLNGAGKTTLFSLVTRLYDSVSGEIRVLGFDVRRQPGQALRRLGVVFQQRTLDLDLTVMQNLLYHGALHGLSRGETRRRAEAELERIGLGDRADDKVRRLSGGQMRRVEIARSLLHRPRLLLLDEPTVGLDIGARQDIIDRVRALCRDDGVGVLWATHLLDEVAADSRVVILHRGRVLDAGSPAEIVARSRTDDLQGAFRRLTAPREAGP